MIVLASVCLMLASFLVVPAPAIRLSRLDGGASPRRAAPSALTVLLAGDPRAPAASIRALIAVAAGAATAWLLPNRFAAVLALVVGVSIFVLLGRWLRPDPAEQARLRELPDVLELVASCLAAGAPMMRALDVVADISPAATRAWLRCLVAEFRVGREPALIWRSRSNDPIWGPVAKDLARSAISGTSVEAGLRIHADEARRRRHEAQLTKARAAGVKSVVPLMLCYLPAFILVGIVPLIAGLAITTFG